MKALFFTAFDRPAYLRETLDSWAHVRGTKDWFLYALIEPSRHSQESVRLFTDISTEFNGHEILVNPQIYGPQHNPWVGMERLLKLHNHEFAVCTEDDHPVSDDILEYFSWANEAYREDPSVGTICAYSKFDVDPWNSDVYRSSGFSAWTWGTWRDRWQNLIGPTWDHDYSTYNGFPGNQSGFDWNLNTRIFPRENLYTIYPYASRSQNIGVYGAHALPELFEQSPSFTFSREPSVYREV